MLSTRKEANLTVGSTGCRQSVQDGSGLFYLFIYRLKVLEMQKKIVMFSVKASLTCRPVRFVTVSHYARARGFPKAPVAVAWLPAQLTHIVNLCQIHYNISRVLLFF